MTSTEAKLESNEKSHLLQFEAYEQALHSGSTGPKWLGQRSIAAIVVETLKYHNGREYDLIAYCVMPNHVHLVVQLVERNSVPLYRILQSIKRYTARHANTVLHRMGQFWQAESYDHVIRDEEQFQNIVSYVLANPVKARLVSSTEDWPWSYCKYFDR